MASVSLKKVMILILNFIMVEQYLALKSGFPCIFESTEIFFR